MELIFTYDMRSGSSFILLYVVMQLTFLLRLILQNIICPL